MKSPASLPVPSSASLAGTARRMDGKALPAPVVPLMPVRGHRQPCPTPRRRHHDRDGRGRERVGIVDAPGEKESQRAECHASHLVLPCLK